MVEREMQRENLDGSNSTRGETFRCRNETSLFQGAVESAVSVRIATL